MVPLIWTYLVLVLLPHHAIPDSDVGFPDREHIDIDRNNTRVPLYIPGKCKLNQLLYPGDQKNDWICDCKPGHLYYAPQDGCFPAYRQGPCPVNEYLTLAPGEFNAKCTPNPCRKDDMAPYAKDGQCYQLHTAGPCEEMCGEGIFGLNSVNLKLECIKGVDRISILNKPLPTKPSLPDQANGKRMCKPPQ